MECRSDESNKSGYEYKYEEDKDNMVVKKFKKTKTEGNSYGGLGANANMSIKDPFTYNEELSY